jgi:hypothetical protein
LQVAFDEKAQHAQLACAVLRCAFAWTRLTGELKCEKCS